VPPKASRTNLRKGIIVPSSHHEVILDQFTRQAEPFSTAPGIRDEEALRRLVASSGAGPADTVLDVACGPGLVVAAFAEVARHVTGIDLTPAMIDRARALQRDRGLANVALTVGDVVPLPYGDAAFSIVVSRFAFHHFPDPAAALREMVRVCRPGGRVVVADAAASPDPARAAAFNRMEKLRDPSHVRALPVFEGAGLPAPAITRCEVRAEVEGLLSRSFPAPGDADRVRALFEASLADDGLGVGARRHDGTIHFAYPVAILVAERPA
jgi:SAM-dependent methyltransferase